MESRQPVRVAIVGSGMAGLVTAYLLQRDSRQRYAVKIFESGASFSLDAASISIASASRIDLPMRAFAGGFYANLKAMYDHLGISYHSQPFLFEFAKVESLFSYFIHASNLHKLPPPRPSAVTTISYVIEVVYLLACYTWFSMCCFLIAPRDSYGANSETLDQYMRRIWLPDYFVTFYLLPLISSVTTCPHEVLRAFPASDVIEYKRRTHGAPHYTVSNGVKTVQDKLVEGVRCELSTAVEAVKPQGNGVNLFWKKVEGGVVTINEEFFDRVVLAVAPDIVGRVFEPLRRHTERIPTTVVESVVHRDRSMFGHEEVSAGNERHSGAQLIYLRTSTSGIHRTESLHVQPCGAIVTTCPFSPIDPSLAIHSTKFTRVLRSPASRRVVNGIFEDTPLCYGEEKAWSQWKNGDDNVWLVGGWCWDGMVLLEGCVVSAMRVADAFGVDVPWRHRRK